MHTARDTPELVTVSQYLYLATSPNEFAAAAPQTTARKPLERHSHEEPGGGYELRAPWAPGTWGGTGPTNATSYEGCLPEHFSR